MKRKLTFFMGLFAAYGCSVLSTIAQDSSAPKRPVALSTGSLQLNKSNTNLPNVAVPLSQKLPITISDAEFTVGGTFLAFKGKMSAPVLFKVLLSDVPIVGIKQVGSRIVTDSPILNEQTGTGPTIKGSMHFVEPNRNYYLAIVPIKNEQYGSAGVVPLLYEFKTLKRHAIIEIQSIHLLDDSDDLSKGDVAFNFLAAGMNTQINGSTELEDLKDWAAFPGNNNTMQMGTGETVYPNQVLFAEDVGDSMRFAVSCIDDDGDGLQYIHTADGIAMLDGHYFGIQSNDEYESNSRSITLDVDGITFETPADSFSASEVFTFSKTIKALGNSTTSLEYSVSIDVTVWYGY